MSEKRDRVIKKLGEALDKLDKEGETMTKRSLYMCLQARVKNDRIRCAEGHILDQNTKDGTIPITRLVRGAPLELTICQECKDYNEMGPPIPKKERGWADLEVSK